MPWLDLVGLPVAAALWALPAVGQVIADVALQSHEMWVALGQTRWVHDLPALGALHERRAGLLVRAGLWGALLPAVSPAQHAARCVRKYGSHALAADAGLLHAAGPAKLLHVLAEVAVTAVGTQAGLALLAARSPPPGPILVLVRAPAPLGRPLASQRGQTHSWLALFLALRPEQHRFVSDCKHWIIMLVLLYQALQQQEKSTYYCNRWAWAQAQKTNKRHHSDMRIYTKEHHTLVLLGT